MFTRLFARTVLPALFAAVAVMLASAQSQPPPAPAESRTYTMSIVTVQPGMGGEFTNFHKNEVIPAQKKGGATARMAFSSGAFGEPGVFVFFNPIADLSVLDGPNPVVRALGQEAATQLNMRGVKLTKSRRSLLVRTRPDLSYNVDGQAAPAPLSLVSEVEVASGRREDFEGLIRKEVLPLMQKAKVRSYSVLEVLYGANAGTYYTSIGYENYAAIGKGHPFQVTLGDEGTRRFESKFTGIVTRLERFPMRYRDDLSFGMAKPGTN